MQQLQRAIVVAQAVPMVRRLQQHRRCQLLSCVGTQRSCARQRPAFVQLKCCAHGQRWLCGNCNSLHAAQALAAAAQAGPPWRRRSACLASHRCCAAPSVCPGTDPNYYLGGSAWDDKTSQPRLLLATAISDAACLAALPSETGRPAMLDTRSYTTVSELQQDPADARVRSGAPNP